MRFPLKILFFIFLLLLCDQVLKIYVKTHFFLEEKYPLIGQWCNLLFVENEGMAFGWTLGSGKVAKLVLTICRLGVILYFAFLLTRLIKKNIGKPIFFYLFALILSGAMGNLIDSIFYGILFEESTPLHIANAFTHMPYGALFLGKVVDMFYFPLFSGYFYECIPFVGGEDFIFFSPVFNLADAYIFIGLVSMLIFGKRIIPRAT